jgi:cytochrome c-type biogenesis protein CcmH
MTGWLGIVLLSAVVGAALLLSVNARKLLWSPVLAAVVLGMAGYAWQGRPDLPAARAQPIAAERGAAEALIKMRSDMDQNFGQAKSWLNLADGFAREGNYSAAAGIIQGGIKQYPQNADLWSALGLVLMLAADGEMTPPAQLAFEKARKLAPQLPAPDYFEGLSALFERKPIVALEKWGKLLDRATPNAKWRAPLESQYLGLQQMLLQSVAREKK